MAARNSRRRKSQNRFIEFLEERCVMSGQPIEQHFISEMPTLEHHGGFAEERPPLVHHKDPDADFWLNPDAERDIESLLGDIEQTLASAHGLTGLTQVRNNYGFVGTGQTVAIIDSGIAFDHWALGNGLGANYRVVGGWDFAENDANPYDDGPEGSHGTHVAGIVGADRVGTIDDGVAPGVDLVGLRVFDDAGNGYFDWVEYALQWVHNNRNAHENPITAVNLSLGTAWNDTSVPSWSTLEDEFAQLKADGIFVSVSAGNSFTNYNTPGLSYPAASPHVVPVMSLDDNGSLSFFSQRHPSALAAPGRFIVSTVPDYAGNHNGVTDDFASFSGTSMAAPYVAGASVILREAMQFVGSTNITQTTLFNHMMATADTFFDSATGLNYKRLNLNSAINALMPSDEYGSTAATAYNLGTLSGSSEISGLVGTLSDADYFRFTAAANGSVSFTATTSHGLAPVWTGSGGVVSGPQGKTFTFQVVAGQSYTFGLSTSGGIGYYDLAIEATSSFSYVDWGTITQTQVTNIANSGQKWYRVQAARNGYLTAEAFFAAAGGNIDISWHNSSLQLLATGVANASGERVEVTANAGTDYYLRVSGTNADVDFRLTNLVTQSGNTVSVAGTTAADNFIFSVGSTQHSINVNGAAYQFNKASVAAINFSGDAGNDTITMTCTSGNETATLRVGNASISGSGYSSSAVGIESVTVYGGGGTDLAFLYDSSGNDQFHARPDYGLLRGANNEFFNYAGGFDQVFAYSESGGADVAYMYDSAGNDAFHARPHYGLLRGANNEYYNYAGGFDQVFAYAELGGSDVAYMYDSAGNDVLHSRPQYGLLRGANSEFYNYANGFDQVFAYCESGGNDLAYLYDSAGNDVLHARPQYGLLRGASNEFYNYAGGFDQVFAYCEMGGSDVAYMYDSAANDVFQARPEYGLLRGANNQFYNYASGFDQVFAYGESGGTDQAYLYDSSGNDKFHAQPEYGLMRGLNNSYYNLVGGFDQVYAYSELGGTDEAFLYDSSGNDQFYARPQYGLLRGAGFYNYAGGFDQVFAYGESGGKDEAYMYDSAGNDVFHARPHYGLLRGANNEFYNYAGSFDQVFAYAELGGSDVAYMYDSAGNDVFHARPHYGLLRGENNEFYNYAGGFDQVFAYSELGGNDVVYMYDSAGNDRFVWEPTHALMRGQNDEFFNYASGFKQVNVYAESGGVDQATIHDMGDGDSILGSANWAEIKWSDRFINLSDFEELFAHAVPGESPTAVMNAIDYLFQQIGDWA